MKELKEYGSINGGNLAIKLDTSPLATFDADGELEWIPKWDSVEVYTCKDKTRDIIQTGMDDLLDELLIELKRGHLDAGALTSYFNETCEQIIKDVKKV